MTADHRKLSTDAPATPPPVILWVDGVGGYLLLAGQRWTIGRYAPNDSPQIAIRGDLQRGTGSIQRRGSDYLLKPNEELMRDGKWSSRPLPLADGRTVDLGGSVQLRFAQPHPLSASARIELSSRHRFEPACDGVILCADTCVLGASPAAHIPCRHFSGDVVLFAAGTDLRVRCDRPFTIDGKKVNGKPVVHPGQRVEGDDFALTLEAFAPGNIGQATG